MARGRAAPDHRADTRGGRFAGIPLVVIESPAWRHLDLPARAVLVEIVGAFNGYNNGNVVMSFDMLAERLNTRNRRMIAGGLAQLVEHGMIAIETPADRKHHKARAYRLTFISTGGAGGHRQATNDYLGWSAAQKHGADVAPWKAIHGDDVAPWGSSHGDDVALKIERHRRKTANRS